VPSFQVFDKRAVALAGAPTVTFQRTGTISLNAAAFHAMGGPAFVELLYDPDEKVVGLRPLATRLPHAYPVGATRQGRTYRVAGHAFARLCGIPGAVSTRYAAELAGGVLCVDLTRQGTVVARTRRRP